MDRQTERRTDCGLLTQSLSQTGHSDTRELCSLVENGHDMSPLRRKNTEYNIRVSGNNSLKFIKSLKSEKKEVKKHLRSDKNSTGCVWVKSVLQYTFRK